MELLRRRLMFKNAATIAIEIDPRTFTTEMAEASESSRGVPASLDVQSFDPIVRRCVQLEVRHLTPSVRLCRARYTDSFSQSPIFLQANLLTNNR